MKEGGEKEREGTRKDAEAKFTGQGR
jgi:hypothetical protein